MGSLSDSTRSVGGLTGVAATVFVTHPGYEQHAASLPYGSGHNLKVGAQLSPVETPGDTERLVSLSHHAGELAKCSLIQNIGSETQR